MRGRCQGTVVEEVGRKDSRIRLKRRWEEEGMWRRREGGEEDEERRTQGSRRC